MTGVPLLILGLVSAVVIWLGLDLLWAARDRRRASRAMDEAIAITRHPSGSVPIEDRADWPPR